MRPESAAPVTPSATGLARAVHEQAQIGRAHV